MVVYETMRESPEAFAASLARFLGRRLSLTGDGRGDGNNVRNAGGRIWRLRRCDRHAPGQSGSAGRRLAQAALHRLRRGTGSIELTCEINDRILDGYRPANLKLARSLDTDLGRFGHF